MWFFYALLSSVFAALVAIFGKIGLQGVDSTLATTVRSVIMALFLVLSSLTLGKFQGFSLGVFESKTWIFIILSGVAGAMSWLFYFFALKMGLASRVVAIDRLSLVFAVILAAIFLGETLSFKVILGAIFMVAGALLISL